MIAASFLVALILAYCFAASGDLLIGRRSGSLIEWNQSFLVGASATALGFVPLSLLLPHHALVVTATALILIGLLRLRTLRWPRLEVKPDRWSMAFLALIVMALVQFSIQNSRLSYFWDGYQIWATKALVMHQNGALGKEWLGSGAFERLAAYPHLVPLYEALLAKLEGGFDWEALKPIFAYFYLSMLVSTFHATRPVVSPRIAFAVTALLALLPAVSTRFAVGGYVDMPQSVFVAATLAALLEGGHRTGWRAPLPWLLGGLVFIKNEGLVLALVASGIGLTGMMALRPRREQWHRHGGAIAVVTAFLAVRTLWKAWLQMPDPTYGPFDRSHWERAYQNLLTVPELCAREMFSVAEWSVFWPVFFLAALVVLLAGNWRERGIVLGVLAVIGAYMSIFYFTNWDIALHISQAFSRLLTQIAPAAAVVMGVAFARLRGDARNA